MTSHNRNNLGRAAAGVAEVISHDIMEGRRASGQFLPSVRELASVHSVGSKTIWRALKALETQGLIAAEPRQGYRVLPRANDPGRGCPVAYVMGKSEDPREWGRATGQLVEALRAAGDRRRWSLLIFGRGERTIGEILAQLESARTFGLVLGDDDDELISAVRKTGIPAVMINAWVEDAGIDSIMQDGQLGGLLAARHLAGCGCRRIAWFGTAGEDAHSMDRLSGAAAGLDRAGLTLSSDLLIKTGRTSGREAARELLSRPDRPDGIIALWRSRALDIRDAAGDLGLVIGRDFRMVGWCPEEIYEGAWLPLFNGGPVPPAITWSAGTVAETALSRLAERRENPDLPALRVKVPVKLRLADGREEA